MPVTTFVTILRYPLMNTILRWLDIAVYLVFLAFALYFGPRTSAWYAGLCLTIVTVPFWFAARWQLGASFSVRPEAHELVTTGISYARSATRFTSSAAWRGSAPSWPCSAGLPCPSG